MSCLAVERLTLRFGGLTAIDGVSFEVRRGEVFTLIGPNGAGKTSIFNVISRFYTPSAGRLAFEDRDITAVPAHEVARLGIARTFQHVELFPHMSVLDNIMTGRHARLSTNPLQRMLFTPAVRREEVTHREAVERIIEFVELEGVRHALAGALPFGIQKIVGLARALALEPSLLLLDEPSAGLTRDERDDLARFVLRIKHDLKLPMIWIEHDMQMVADLADRVHVLNYGRTLASGAPSSVLNDPNVVKAYLGTHGLHDRTS
jgi:branched-chain amino acid transport system ATP-binding protein